VDPKQTVVWWWTENQPLLKEEKLLQIAVDEVPMEKDQQDEIEMVAERNQELYSVAVVVFAAVFPCSTTMGTETSNDFSVCRMHIHHRLPLVWAELYSENGVEQQRQQE
jgi:hypothetical protein